MVQSAICNALFFVVQIVQKLTQLLHERNIIMARRNLPGYLKHKATGQAFCVINGRFFYLGRYGSKASREKYEQIIAEYLTNGKKLPPTRSQSELLIETLVFRYLEYAEKYYSNQGKPTEAFGHCRLALESVVRYYGKNYVSEFGPLSLVFIRDKWVDNGIARKTINRWTGVIKQTFQWGVTYELVEAEIYHAINAVANLKMGRTAAPEYNEVLPVDHEIVDKTIPFLPPVVADIGISLSRHDALTFLSKTSNIIEPLFFCVNSFNALLGNAKASLNPTLV